MNKMTYAILGLTAGLCLGFLTGLRLTHAPEDSVPSRAERTLARQEVPPQAATSRAAVTPGQVGSASVRRPVETEMLDVEARLGRLQKQHAELTRQRDELARDNEALADAKQLAEQERVAAEQNTEFIGKIAAKVIAANKLTMPESLAEAAVLAGRLGRKLAEFKASFFGKPPAEGTPEYVAYKQEIDALTSEWAPVVKALGGDDGGGLMRQMSTPQGAAEFQALQIYGTLDLSERQFEQVYGILSRHYGDGFARKLDLGSRPETGVEAWVQQRVALNDRAVADVRGALTPDQQAVFDKLIGKQLLWQINIGGGM